MGLFGVFYLFYLNVGVWLILLHQLFYNVLDHLYYPLFLDNTIGVWLFFTFSHMLYWKFYGEKEYNKLSDKDIEELDLTIQVLKDIQKERK